MTKRTREIRSPGRVRGVAIQSAGARRPLPLPALDRLGELPGSGGELAEGQCDGGHAHSRAGSAERFDGIVESLPRLGRSERTPPRSRAQLLGRSQAGPGRQPNPWSSA